MEFTTETQLYNRAGESFPGKKKVKFTGRPEG